MKALIIDDEPLARQRIRMLLEEEKDVQLIGEFQNGKEALPPIQEHKPDLIFLDVQMPEMDGFQMLSQLSKEDLPIIIFTTAYDQYALQAFEIHAIDYLLKPFKPARFKEALQHAREHQNNRTSKDVSNKLQALLAATQTSEPKQTDKYLQRLTVKSEEKITLVKTADIECIESAGNYVVAKVGNENHILRESLSSLEQNLDPSHFIRISRGAIVNLEFVRELSVMFKGEYAVILKDGKELTMTRGIREMEQALRFS